MDIALQESDALTYSDSCFVVLPTRLRLTVSDDIRLNCVELS
jgi:hypothetical protein